MSFAIGQRWISESEHELGLGLIVEVDRRTVTIFFPACDERRVYALTGAPLIRVQFQAGDVVVHHEGWKATVIDVLENNGGLIYSVRRLDNQTETMLREMDLSHRISFGKPQDRLFAVQIDRSDRFALRYRALQRQQAQFQSPLRGLRGVRAGLIPHQLHIAREVGQRVNPRVLLADEVGLGKTIEAGMILQQQLFAGKVERVLILVPENLQHQWLVEMLRRFNLHFALFDEERAADFAATEYEAERNPFDTENRIICSLDWLLSRPQRAQQLIQSEFDMLIVDEAHHLSWHEQHPSPAYRLVEQLVNRIPSVLLLTATPEQLGLESHFARLRLLDPNRFYDYAAFVAEQQRYQPVAEAVQSLLSDDQPLTAVLKNRVSDLLEEQDVEPFFKAIAAGKQEGARARQELIRNLIDRHGTSRLLFRNTRQGVKGFPRRHYHQVTLEMPRQYADAVKMTQLPAGSLDERLFYPERIFHKFNPEAKWWEFDPRLMWLITFLKAHREEKVLVICRHADTAIRLEQTLREKEAIRGALFHERMSIVERDRAAAYFSQQENGAQVLLSSAIGSEGRNFQFSRHLVLFSLPHTPDLLEQCIGRLDRIGQTRDIEIYLPCFAATAQARLARWYHEGLNAFEETCPMGATLFEKCGAELASFFAHPDEEAFTAFVKRTHQQQTRLKARLEQGRDRLLELNSAGGEAARQLAVAITAEDQSADLVNFTLNLFDIIGVEQEDLGEQAIVISPTGTMLVPDFPGLKEEGVTVTFDRQLALAREEVEFLSWDHPMLRNGIDLITSGDIGKTAASVLINRELPAGTLLLELIYIVESQAPKSLQLTRFLPPTPVRVLLNGKGNDLAAQIGFERLESQLKPMGKNIVSKVVKMTRANIERMIQAAEDKIAAQARQIIAGAKQQAEQTLDEELNRLLALKAVNKNIRRDEIEYLERMREQTLIHLSQANWRLDSLRLIVTNNV
ncbi:RNA polymerase-associated protein RapA [Pasteurellaceae bacterium LIM206]|nr:RNA polymerase-associated protein RapA [Pasteurellaceae bacterium LIM206]